jgi:hypothetical protein
VKKAIYFTCFLFIGLLIFQQPLVAQQFKGGISAGFVNTDVLGIDPYDIDLNKFSISGGGFVSLQIAPGKSFQVELLYIRKGSYQPPDVANNIYSFYRLNLNYVEMPFVYKKRLNFNTKTGNNDKLEIEGGAYVGILLGVKHENEYGEFTDRPFHKIDPGLLLGLSYYLNPNCAINLRFSGSAIPIRSHVSNTAYWFNLGEYNTVINYSLRYFIH